MKPQKKNINRLSLNKQTVAKLENSAMSRLKGGEASSTQTSLACLILASALGLCDQQAN